MTRTRSRLFPAAAGSLLLAATVLLSGCSAFDSLTSSDDPSPSVQCITSPRLPRCPLAPSFRLGERWAI